MSDQRTKRTRRYRQKNHCPKGSEDRVHDFLKGFGTVCKDGSVLWDWWRPATKRQRERNLRRMEKFAKNPKFIFPVIKNFTPAVLSAKEICETQPMGSSLYMDFRYNNEKGI